MLEQLPEVQHTQDVHSEPLGQLDKVMAGMGGRPALLGGDTAVDSVQWVAATDSDFLAGSGTGVDWEGEGAGHSDLLKGAPLR